MIYKSYLIEENIKILKNNCVLFYGENLGLIEDLKRQNSQYEYLTENFLKYANPFDVEEKWIPNVASNFKLELPQPADGTRFQGVDIGSTIAGEGSPVLTFIHVNPPSSVL